MSELVCQNAMMQGGIAPAALIVTSQSKVLVDGLPVATIVDFEPAVNVPTIGMCMSIANPVVAAATAAAGGVLTPMPCVPATTSPWTPGSQSVAIGGIPALDDACICLCTWAGEQTITFAGQEVATG
jgi:hypothetical protein